MNIYNAIERVEDLDQTELKHCLQLIDVEIARYEQIIRNYSTEKMEKYGRPMLDRLNHMRSEVLMRIK